jgi:hypothetical protein
MAISTVYLCIDVGVGLLVRLHVSKQTLNGEIDSSTKDRQIRNILVTPTAHSKQSSTS